MRDRADRVLAELPGCSLAWSDEFDGPAGSPPAPGTWQQQTGGHGWGNRQLQYYTGNAENAALDGAGHLVITVDRAQPQARGRQDGCGYTSARLTSKDRLSVRYGVVQARMQIPEGRGMWPAFWMMGQDVAVGGNASVTPGPTAAFPQRLLVDYVRVYATPGAAR